VTTSTTASSTSSDDNDLIEAVLAAGGALMSVVRRSLHDIDDDVTLAQHRALVELETRGPLRVADLASALAVDRSAATRMCDRPVRKQLACRRRLVSDRRGVRVALTAKGQTLVTTVGAQRRREVSRLVRRLAPEDRGIVLYALQRFARAADATEPNRPAASRRVGNGRDGQTAEETAGR
jgi:DNA-binding MarR family transcriptional regulator